MSGVSRLHHAWEHSYLGLERGTVGQGKTDEVMLEDGPPAFVGSLGKPFYLGRRDVLSLHHRATGMAGFHGYHDQMSLQESECHLVGGILNL